MLDRISLDDDQLIFDTQSLDTKDVHEFLRAYGCHSPEKLDLIGRDLFLLEPSAWDEGYVPFFANTESMWHTLRTRSKSLNTCTSLAWMRISMLQFHDSVICIFA